MNEQHSFGRIAVTVDGDTLVCQIDDKSLDDSEVAWTLHRGDFNPRRASPPLKAGTSARFTLPDQTNCYVVRAVTSEGATYQSSWVQHYDRQTRDDYAVWRSEVARARSIEHASVPPPLFRYEEPHQNIALVCHGFGAKTTAVERLARENDLVVSRYPGVHWDRMTVLSALAPATDESGAHYLFGGVTRTADRLIFGQGDVEEYVPAVASLRDEVGEFHLLSISGTEVYFGKDFIGLGHLFYYQSDELFVAANGLHFLALTLRALGVKLEIDDAVAKSVFFSTSYPFETHSGTRTAFKNVRRLSVYSSIRIAPHGVMLDDTELRRSGQDGELSVDEYEVLLRAACEEVKDNLSIAVDHPRFENVVVELSAGLDSRIIYAALTNLPPSPKVRIYTRPDRNEKEVAAAVNNLYGIPWDDLPRVRSFDGASGEGLPFSSHSVFMDGFYIERMFRERENYVAETLLITGHSGEAFSRIMSPEGFFCRDFQDRLAETPASIDDVRSGVFRCVGNHQVWYDAGERYFSEILDECLASSSSEQFARKFNDFYVSERNPMVGGSVFRGAMTAPQWRPLQSKSLYRLKALWFQHHPDYRIQFDLIRSLNPLLSLVPYAQPVERARLDEFAQYRAPFRLKKPVDFDMRTDDLMRATRRSDGVSRWLPSQAEYESTQKRIEAFEESTESFLAPLAEILRVAPEFEEMGLPLFSYVRRVKHRSSPRHFSKRHNIRNKLHILLAQIALASPPARHG